MQKAGRQTSMISRWGCFLGCGMFFVWVGEVYVFFWAWEWMFSGLSVEVFRGFVGWVGEEGFRVCDS